MDKEIGDQLSFTLPKAEQLAEMPADELEKMEAEIQAASAEMPDKMMDDPMPEAASDEPVVVLQGQFQDADSFHQGSGSATVYQLPDGSHVLRFEDFMATNGPDLHVILTSHPAPATHADIMDNYIDLGSLKGNIGNQNYEIPADVDISQYQSVVIYCMPFHVVFSTAALGS
ncbi:MAG: DM13 domain-containing protein [Anaerolineae bacterium]|nr:DM13 domain-containing protein [Anaerolineae bacterium]